eukprot:3467683-Rhodomonas_salina.1
MGSAPWMQTQACHKEPPHSREAMCGSRKWFRGIDFAVVWALLSDMLLLLSQPDISSQVFKGTNLLETHHECTIVSAPFLARKFPLYLGASQFPSESRTVKVTLTSSSSCGLLVVLVISNFEATDDDHPWMSQLRQSARVTLLPEAITP